MRKLNYFIKKHKIKFIQATFLDLLGEIRQFVIPINRLNECIKFGLKCDGSSINCLNDVKNSDTKIFLDKNSFYLLPNGNALIFCYTDSKYDARQNLYNYQQFINKQNLTVNFGAELEFFLFNNTKTVFNYSNSLDGLKYLNPAKAEFENCLLEIADFCKDKINLEAVHHECANNQFEIDFKYASPLQTADNIVFLKTIIKYFANKHNLVACFMPKPLNNTSGSGMHINMSVFKKSTNLFYDKTDTCNLSSFAYSFINNIFKHIGGITAFANPIVNSYKRLNTGFETPSTINYSAINRSALIRIPKATKNSTRLELRSPDVACNPYLTFLAILQSSFDNTAENLPLLKQLPTNLSMAINHLQKDPLLNQLVPQSYIDKKLLEQQLFDNRVTNFDFENYFAI